MHLFDEQRAKEQKIDGRIEEARERLEALDRKKRLLEAQRDRESLSASSPVHSVSSSSSSSSRTSSRSWRPRSESEPAEPNQALKRNGGDAPSSIPDCETFDEWLRRVQQA